VSGAWRLGAAAADAAPALLKIASATDDAVPQARARALRSLATVVPDDTRARAAFLAAADDPAPDVRLAAVAGLARQASPTPAERAAVASHEQDPALRALVRATLARPSWQAVR
jgi:HEAT repeat protein